MAVPARDRRRLDHLLDHRRAVRARARGRQHHERALPRGPRRDGDLGRALHPDHEGLRHDRRVLVRPSVRLGADRPRGHVPARRHHRVLHGLALGSGQADLRRLADRPRDEHHRRARGRHAGDGAAGDRDRGRHPAREPLRRALRDRRRRHGAALDDGPDRGARRVRACHRQRGRHRRDGRPAARGARRSPTSSTPSATRRRP